MPTSTRHQVAQQQTLFDPEDDPLAVTLALLPFPPQDVGQLVLVFFELDGPRASGSQEVLRDVNDLYVVEMCCFHQFVDRSVRSDRPGAETDGSTMLRLREVRRHHDREVSGDSRRLQQSFAGSQHGELGRDSAQHVRVGDRIEGPRRKGKRLGRCDNRPRYVEIILRGPAERCMKALIGQVCERDPTSRDL